LALSSSALINEFVIHIAKQTSENVLKMQLFLRKDE